MAMQIMFEVIVLVCLLFPKSDCNVIGTTVKPYPGCGLKLDREYNTGVAGSIAGGKVSRENAYPWMAFLYNFDRQAYGIDVMELDLPPACKKTTTTTPTSDSFIFPTEGPPGQQSFCGGSVINPRYILTAAHCVACRTSDDLAVVVGGNVVEVEKLDSEEFDKFRFLSKIQVFPQYKRGVKEDLKNNPDIALLQLETPLIFGPKINAICLPTNPASLYEEKTMIVAGWGLTEHFKTSDKLRETIVEVYPNDLCKKWLCPNAKKCYDFLKSFHLCTFSENLRSHCRGDSGSPLMMVDSRNSGRYTQTAVASFGPTIKSECGRRPGGFTRLTPEVLDWVKIASGMEDHAGIKSLDEYNEEEMDVPSNGSDGSQSTWDFAPDGTRFDPNDCWEDGSGPCPNGNCWDDTGRKGVVLLETTVKCQWYCLHRAHCKTQKCCARA